MAGSYNDPIRKAELAKGLATIEAFITELDAVLSKPENASFKGPPYMSATKNVKLGSAFGLEVIAARGLMIARLTGFRDCPEATAAIYTAMASTVKPARDVVQHIMTRTMLRQ